MLEKSSTNVKCHYCSNSASECIAGYPICDVCKAQDKYKKDQNIQQLFVTAEQGSKDGK